MQKESVACAAAASNYATTFLSITVKPKRKKKD